MIKHFVMAAVAVAGFLLRCRRVRKKSVSVLARGVA